MYRHCWRFAGREWRRRRRSDVAFIVYKHEGSFSDGVLLRRASPLPPAHRQIIAKSQSTDGMPLGVSSSCGGAGNARIGNVLSGGQAAKISLVVDDRPTGVDDNGGKRNGEHFAVVGYGRPSNQAASDSAGAWMPPRPSSSGLLHRHCWSSAGGDVATDVESASSEINGCENSAQRSGLLSSRFYGRSYGGRNSATWFAVAPLRAMSSSSTARNRPAFFLECAGNLPKPDAAVNSVPAEPGTEASGVGRMNGVVLNRGVGRVQAILGHGPGPDPDGVGRFEVMRPPSFMRLQVREHTGGGHHHHYHDHDHASELENEKAGKAGERISRIGLWADVALTLGKGAAGWISGSTAIIADALHSVSDIGLSGVTLWSLRAARMPKDKEHPYGHGKYETVGALGVSSLLLITGGGIAWHAVEVLQALLPSIDALTSAWEGGSAQAQALVAHVHGMHSSCPSPDDHHHGLDPEHMDVALAAAVMSIGIKEGLYQVTKAVGDRVGSKLLEANAWHHRSDAVSSLIALVGVGGAMAGVPWLDPLAGLLVSGMIIKASVSIGRQSLQELLDAGVPESVLAPIRETALQVKDVEGIHHLRGRRMGPFIMCDLHIEVDPWLSVSAAHNIGETVRRTLRAKNSNIGEVLVHIDPADGRKPTLTPAELESLAKTKGQEHDDLQCRHVVEHGDDHHQHLHPGVSQNNDSHLEHSKDGHVDVTSKTLEAMDDQCRRPELEIGRSHGEVASTSSHAHSGELLDSNQKQWEMKEQAAHLNDGHTLGTDNTEMRREDHAQLGPQANVKGKLKSIIDERFPEIQGVSHVTCHFLNQGVLVHAEVLMNPELRIREAMEIARKVEKAIEAEVDGISKADIHLELNQCSHR